MAPVTGGSDGDVTATFGHVPAAAGRGQRIGPVERQVEVAATLVLAPRDRSGLVAKAQGAIGFRRADVDAVHRPDAATLRRVLAWCDSRGLTAEVGGDGYFVEARGPVADVEAAFSTRLDTYAVGRVRGRAVRVEPQLPAQVAGDVVAVLGLNDLARPWRGRPQRPGGAAGGTGPAAGAGYLPAEIARAYGLPEPRSGLDGKGETAVVFEFGSGFQDADLATFWQQARVEGPRVSRLWALAPGQVEPPPPAAAADVEATADVEWLGALAPGARVVAVNAVAGQTSVTFAQALARALAVALRLKPTPAVISISYGDAEAFFAPSELLALDLLFARAAAMGTVVVAASGDSGAYGVPVPVGALECVDAPACLTHVLAVGGTRLELQDGVVARELGWSNSGGTGASGGGLSAVFATPEWQDADAVAKATGGGQGRGVPDVCANADPLTGYRVVLSDRLAVVGGTSLAAPVWAAALTLVQQARRMGGAGPLGLAAPAIYPIAGRPTRVRDILVGDNAFLSAPGYRCQSGWDAVTGLGAPAGPALWEALAAGGWPQPAPTLAPERPPALPPAPPEPMPSEAAPLAPEPTAAAPEPLAVPDEESTGAPLTSEVEPDPVPPSDVAADGPPEADPRGAPAPEPPPLGPEAGAREDATADRAGPTPEAAASAPSGPEAPADPPAADASHHAPHPPNAAATAATAPPHAAEDAGPPVTAAPPAAPPRSPRSTRRAAPEASAPVRRAPAVAGSRRRRVATPAGPSRRSDSEPSP